MRIAFVSVLAIVGLLCTAPQRAASQETIAASRVAMHLNYTGSGAIDEKHKIYVVSWDSPALATAEHVKPVEIQPHTASRGLAGEFRINCARTLPASRNRHALKWPVTFAGNSQLRSPRVLGF